MILDIANKKAGRVWTVVTQFFQAGGSRSVVLMKPSMKANPDNLRSPGNNSSLFVEDPFL